MKPFLVFLVLFSLAARVDARVGETLDQLKKRYGEPIKHTLKGANEGLKWPETYTYKKGEVLITVQPKDNVCVFESYHSTKKLDADTVRTFLEANKGDSTWVEISPGTTNDGDTFYQYQTKDRTRFGQYFLNCTDGGETVTIELREVAKAPNGF